MNIKISNDYYCYFNMYLIKLDGVALVALRLISSTSNKYLACIIGQGDVGQMFWIDLEKRYVWCVTQTKRSIFLENKIYVVHTPHTLYLTR